MSYSEVDSDYNSGSDSDYNSDIEPTPKGKYGYSIKLITRICDHFDLDVEEAIQVSGIKKEVTHSKILRDIREMIRERKVRFYEIINSTIEIYWDLMDNKRTTDNINDKKDCVIAYLAIDKLMEDQNLDGLSTKYSDYDLDYYDYILYPDNIDFCHHYNKSLLTSFNGSSYCYNSK
tara:strand:+ start:5334 stop:5861 length:528 start_codon:yes stop_codon:yes gene_type:complete